MTKKNDKDLEEYPEKIPDIEAEYENIGLTFDNIKDSQVDINKRIHVLEKKISTLNEKYTINDYPMLEWFVDQVEDINDLYYFGNALIKLHKIVPELRKLKEKKGLLDTAEKDPYWVAATLGKAISMSDDDIEKWLHSIDKPNSKKKIKELPEAKSKEDD